MTEEAPTPSRCLVVGYDGSASSRAAVELAARNAGPGGRVIVVHAYSVPADYVGAPYYQDMLDRTVERAKEVLADLDSIPTHGAEIHTDVVPGAPGEVVCDVAKVRDADAIVMGSRGVGRVGALLGSVAHDVLHRASCPVLVIPQRMVNDD